MAAADDPSRDSGARWHSVTDRAALDRAAYARVEDAAAKAIERRGRFLIVVAGGNTPQPLYGMLRELRTDWSRWHVYFGDERCLPPDDAQRNSHELLETWLDRVPIPPAQCHVPSAEFGATVASRSYADVLHGVGLFDLVLLGLGEDGHTASLFPGHAWGTEEKAPDVLAVFDAPKPPPERITLSASRLSRARAVIFLVYGESKREAVRLWRAGADIPARAIRPQRGVDVLVKASLLANDA